MSRYQAESELFYVDTYEFNEDGTFENRQTALQQDTNPELGYNSIISGTYSLVENKLSIQETEFLTLPVGKTIWYTSLDKLVGSDWNRDKVITVSMRKEGHKWCWILDPVPPTSCVSDQSLISADRQKMNKKADQRPAFLYIN